MSINPAQVVGPESAAQPAESNSRALPAHGWTVPGQASSPPEAGNAPKQDINVSENKASSSELPQDEVQLQRDSQTNGDIVVKYMDHSGNVILQVPSTELLGLARSITEEFQSQAKARAAAVSGTRGEGEGHGH